jgi:mono/diheme cytochrome c family protein
MSEKLRREGLIRSSRPKFVLIRNFILICSVALAALCIPLFLFAQGDSFHKAPTSAVGLKNPYAGDANAAAGGKKLYAQNCAQCHGNNLQGMGPAPTLESANIKSAKPGELFWFITNGDLNNGMPSWSNLPKQQRWQLVTFLESRNK